MKRNPWLAGVLSLIFPGLGHVYAGNKALGAAFMLAFIIGNLNVIWLSIYAGLQTDLSFFNHAVPRLLHYIFAFYGIAFWIWQSIDAYCLAKRGGGA